MRLFFFFFQAEDGIRDADVTGVQTCALPICTGEAAEQVEEAEAPSREPREDDDAYGDGMETVPGSTPEQVRRAAQLEARSYRHVQRIKQRATEAHDRAVEALGRAAQLHDRQADLGWGNVEEHREQA